MNKMSEGEIGYLAGLFDGEGWFVIHKARLGIHLASTDYDVIEWLHKTTGVGQLNGPRQTRTGVKPQWIWSVGVHDQIEEVIEAILPYPMSKRRKERARELLAEIQLRRERAEWRTTHFVCGHEKVENNTYHTKQGKTVCRECSLERARRK